MADGPQGSAARVTFESGAISRCPAIVLSRLQAFRISRRSWLIGRTREEMPATKIHIAVVFVLFSVLPTQIENGFAAAAYLNPFWAASTAFQSWGTLSSLVQSLMTRVAALRASRGDHAGAQRARGIAEGLDSSLQRWRIIGSMGWDYFAHYAWRRPFARPSVYSQVFLHLDELLSAFGEVLQLRSETEKAQWISRNYQRILRISKSLLRELLEVFGQPGALHESMLAIQKEIIEGDLISDLLQLGAADLKGLLQVAKDMTSRYFGPKPTNPKSNHAEL